jgi:predicted glutamine amidotransferase
MCGIAGIYLNTPDDPKLPTTAEREAFIDGLLKGIESRGKDAAGVVAVQRGASVAHLEKADITASEFIKWRKPLPENSRIVLCHTRAATKGSPKNLDNNHPVVHKTCYVTHNGHIRNDDELFEENKLDRIAQVDSEAIPALIDKHGLDKVHLALQELEGGFAIAAIQPEVHPDVLVLAKGRNSPLVYLETEQGLIWASTRTAIQEAWKAVWGKAPEFKVFEELEEGELLYVEDGKIEKLKFKVKQYTTTSTSSSTGGWTSYGSSSYYTGPNSYEVRFTNTKNHRRTCKCGHSQWRHSGISEPYGICIGNSCRCAKFEYARYLTKREWRKHPDYKRVQEERTRIQAREAKEREARKGMEEARKRREAARTTYVDSIPPVKGQLRLVYENTGERKVYDDGVLVAVQFKCDGCEAYQPTKGRAKMGSYTLCIECWGEECDLCGGFFDPNSLTQVEVGSDTPGKDTWYLCRTCYEECNVAEDPEFGKIKQEVKKEADAWDGPTGPSQGQLDGLIVDDMAISLTAEELGVKSPFLYELLFDMEPAQVAGETWLNQAYLISRETYRRTLSELRQGLPQTTSRALAVVKQPASVGEAVELGGESPVGSECGVRVFADED